MTPTALEASFAAICEKHDLLNMGVTYHAPSGAFFCVSLQWQDNCGRHCVQQHGPTIAGALGNALAEMRAERRNAEPIPLADEALPEIA